MFTIDIRILKIFFYKSKFYIKKWNKILERYGQTLKLKFEKFEY